MAQACSEGHGGRQGTPGGGSRRKAATASGLAALAGRRRSEKSAVLGWASTPAGKGWRRLCLSAAILPRPLRWALAGPGPPRDRRRLARRFVWPGLSGRLCFFGIIARRDPGIGGARGRRQPRGMSRDRTRISGAREGAAPSRRPWPTGSRPEGGAPVPNRDQRCRLFRCRPLGRAGRLPSRRGHGWPNHGCGMSARRDFAALAPAISASLPRRGCDACRGGS